MSNRMRSFKEAMLLTSVLMWIPLGVLAFLFSPIRIDIKLLIAAGASFLAMFILFLKDC